MIPLKMRIFSLFVIFLCLIRQTLEGFTNLTISQPQQPTVIPPIVASGSLLNDDIDDDNEDDYQVCDDCATNLVEAVSESAALIFVSTLDGSLNAVSKTTGQVVWTLKEEPVLKTPLSINHKNPMFLPNPKDGSLYTFGGIGYDTLQKLPFSIPDLVASAPQHTSDGTLYTGYKKDAWFAIDMLTGIKVQTLDMDGLQPEVCPTPGGGDGDSSENKGESMARNTIFIGRTEYSLVMFDSVTRQIRWNATFMDYSAHVEGDNTKDSWITNYGLRHFASTSDGSVVTMDDDDGDVTWTQDYGSPVVAIYALDDGRALRKVPLASVAGETLEHLTGRVTSTEWRARFREHDGVGGRSAARDYFYPVLYIGEQATCFYALPALTDGSRVTIASAKRRPLLLDGPGGRISPRDSDSQVISARGLLDNREPGLQVGYHEVPDTVEVNAGIGRPRQIADRSGFDGRDMTHESANLGSVVNVTPGVRVVDVDTVLLEDMDSVQEKIGANMTDTHIQHYLLSSIASKGAIVWGIVFLIGLVFVMKQWKRLESTGVQATPLSGTESTGSSADKDAGETSVVQRSADGMHLIGKIAFDPNAVIGHGCAGTFVYRGRFDGRDVAVKRLLPECFTIADREVALLRETDQHANVVRYYVTERDSQFCYIALELGAATLHDYVERRRSRRGLVDYCDDSLEAIWNQTDPVRLLYETMLGIAHLHSLNIVHRDVKPQNVLLSRPDSRQCIRAMISDFGLCKKLSVGHHSLSKRSGVAGTDGWIAPEMLDYDSDESAVGHEGDSHRMTCTVDVFSAGCVIYYVLTGGNHPYGEPLSRQANIMSGQRSLEALSQAASRGCVAVDLVSSMTERDQSSRPSASSVLRHPLFWDGEQILSYLEAVSDRLEKLQDMDPNVLRLESGAMKVVGADWTQNISEELRRDLRRFRSYKPYSVRDLLRAIRNKRHHFRELDDDVKASLGHTSKEYTEYFTARFPRLLVHTYDAMKSTCSNEQVFQQFY